MEEALQRLERSLRREYDEAMEMAPALVQEESPFYDFVQVENGNVDLAAKRLCLYWKYRKQVFGEDRWLLRLNQTGSGALSLADIELLRTGFFMNPLAMPGVEHSPVLLVDLSRLSHVSTFAETRIAYYFCYVFRHDERIRTQGSTAVHVVTSAPRPPVNTDLESWKISMTALPMRFAGVIVVQSYEEGRQRLIESFAFQQAMVVQFRSQQAAYRAIVAGNSVSETLQLAQARGIERYVLPVSLGGTFTDSKFQDWIRQRISIEDVLSSAPLRVNDDLRFRAVANQQKEIQRFQFPMQQQRQPPVASTIMYPSTDTKKNNERNHEQVSTSTSTTSTAMIPHARPRRSRFVASAETSKLQEQIKIWQERNQSVKMDNRRLEAHLSAARLLVAVLHSVETAVAAAAAAMAQDNTKPH